MHENGQDDGKSTSRNSMISPTTLLVFIETATQKALVEACNPFKCSFLSYKIAMKSHSKKSTISPLQNVVAHRFEECLGKLANNMLHPMMLQLSVRIRPRLALTGGRNDTTAPLNCLHTPKKKKKQQA
jgi:hypothetical protein